MFQQVHLMKALQVAMALNQEHAYPRTYLQNKWQQAQHQPRTAAAVNIGHRRAAHSRIRQKEEYSIDELGSELHARH